MSTAHFTPIERRITIAGIMIVFLLSALDQSVVSTAMPRIISELHGLELYSWVTTAYLLTSTVIVPIAGKMGDLIGRKPVLVASILFFVVGSWLSGLSGEFGSLPVLGGGMTQLIVFRAVQGIGGGALFTTAFAVIGDLYPARERGKLSGMFAAVFGLSSVLGPLVGGYFTDMGTTHLFGYAFAGWRWVFYLNLPLSFISLFMVLVKMPKMSHQLKGKIDFIGAALVIACVVPLLLALTYGGHAYPWDSPFVLGLFAASLVGLVLYLVAERFTSDPILPLDLFKNKVFTTVNISGFFISMSFMSAVAFLPLLMQIGQNVRATASGLTMLPLMAGMMGGAIISGRLVSATGKYRALLVGGVAVSFIAIVFMSRVGVATSRLDLAWRMFLLGLGLGPSNSVIQIVLQNAAPPSQLGVVTSSASFFRQIGATVGIAVFGTLLTNGLNSSLNSVMPGVDVGKLQGMSMAAQAGAAPAIPEFLRVIIVNVITHTFTLSLFIVGAAFVATLFIPHVPMRDHGHPKPLLEEEAAEMALTAPGSVQA